MDGDADGNEREDNLHNKGFCDKESAVKQSNPQQADRNNLDPERNRLIFPEIGNVWPQMRMIHKPMIQTWGTSDKQSRRQQ